MNLLENLKITTVSQSDKQVVLTIPVTEKICQPFGIVHGGINAVLAETAASLGANAWLTNHHLKMIAVGTSVDTHHLRQVSQGTIKVVATPVHTGHTTQVWQAQTSNGGNLTSTSTVTLANRSAN